MAAAPRYLYVLRHAKSSWDDPALSDHDRPLAPRGRKSAKLLRAYLREESIQPGLVLCSTARRARETLEGVDPTGERVFEADLYGATAGELIERLKLVPEEIQSVMVIGHNPGMQELVLVLGGAGRGVGDKFPTAALATFTTDCAWSELQPGCAVMTRLVRPKDLA